MLYLDPTTGLSYLVIEGQVNGFPQQYYTSGSLEAQQQSSLLLAQHPTSTLQQAYDTPAPSLVSNQQQQQLGYRSIVSTQSEIDELIDLSNLLNEESSSPADTQEQVAELATNLKNSLPSSPVQPPSSPSIMQRTEQLPGINSLSGELSSSLQAQLLAPLNSSSVKKQYPFYSSPSHRVSLPQVSSQPSVVLPPLPPTLPSLPSITGRPPAPQPPQRAVRIQVPSPESSPCCSPPLSPKRNKKNYTKEFNLRFHELLNHNEHASNEWHLYAQRHKGKCTIKRAPCIKVSRGFCASYGDEFTDLAKEEKYGALGTRTECACMHKPASLSSAGPSRKQRQASRSSPYPTPSQSQSSPSTPDLELPSTPPADPSSPLTKQAWISFLLQSAPMLHDGFNTFLGGLQCSACHARRAFASRDEVIAYLMREPIHCAQDCCAGHMQVHQ